MSREQRRRRRDMQMSWLQAQIDSERRWNRSLVDSLGRAYEGWAESERRFSSLFNELHPMWPIENWDRG